MNNIETKRINNSKSENKTNINNKANTYNENNLEELKEEISNIKEILSQKIFDKEHLMNCTCKNIETDYILKFGLFEYKSAEYELETKKIERKLYLINKEIQKQNKSNIPIIKTKPKTEIKTEKLPKTEIKTEEKQEIDLIAIENHINNEFKKEEEKLKEHEAKVTISLEESKKKKIDYKDYKKLNTIYRDCIRRMHPDLFKNQSQYEENLYFNSKEAYEDEDLKEMEAVKILIHTHTSRKNELQTINELNEFKDILKIRLELTEREIKEIINSSPYNKQNFLLDKDKVKQYQEELKKEILEKEKEYMKYETNLSDLIKEKNIVFKRNS